MQSSVSLNDNWKVSWTDGVHGLRIKEDFYQYPIENDQERYLDINLPVDMNSYFMENMDMGDVNTENNHLKYRWISEQVWQFVKEFEFKEDIKDERLYLHFEKLDYRAHIYLNDELLRIHDNAFVPCRIDVTSQVKKGKNKLIVGLESGVYHTAEKEGQRYQNMLAGSLTKSQWLRKPLYQFGWDWNPILINVGITGNVSLEKVPVNKIDQVSLFHSLNEDLSKALLQVGLTFWNKELPKDACIEIQVEGIKKSFPLQESDPEKLQKFELEIDNIQTWWPVSYGKQKLYNIKISLLSGNDIIDVVERKTGFRKVELDRSSHPEDGEYFIIKVNNTAVFAKGANWVPPDVIYGKDNDEKIEKLVDLALEANFNILRIWGGGEYAPKKLVDLCDEKGILLWHDFLFACFKFPGDDADYVENVKKDTTWAIREYSSHPSMVVWCGNNEIQWIHEQVEQNSFTNAPDYNLYHEIIPGLIEQEGCNLPYWPGSPYSPGEIENNNPHIGDQHPWQFPLLGQLLEMWQYRKQEDRFPNEGGVLGVSVKDTLQDFMNAEDIKIRSFTWESHDNTCNYWDNNLGFSYGMLKEWLGLDYKNLSPEEYIYASSLLQSEGLMEYIMNYRCRKFDSSSAIFWMYNDSWPATHSWSIVDYYLRKKPAWYSVKRSFQPVFTGLKQEDGLPVVYVVNDLLENKDLKIKIGLIDTQHQTNQILHEQELRVNKNSKRQIFSFDARLLPEKEQDHLIPYSILSDVNGNIISQNRMFMKKYRNMKFNPPNVKISDSGDYWEFSSDVFVWAVALDISGKAAFDNFFDLIPGHIYKFPKRKAEAEPKLLFTGNNL